MAGRLKPHLKENALIVTLAKGIDAESLKTMDEVLADALGDRPFALLNGPMLAEELVKGMGGAGVIGTARAEDFARLHGAFEGTGLRLEHSDDVHGVALAGVLKNVFAIGLGVAGGLGWGDNMKGWLVAHSSMEMRRIIVALGGREETALTQAGLGDMVATGFSPHSSNHRFGKSLAQTGQCDHRAEGCVSLPPLAALLEGKEEGLIVYRAIRAIVIDGADAHETFGRLIP
jgi:glycerol-3-phosphate dehydrogenase (NAD(P)+)